MAGPRVVIGSPLFNHEGDFREAIESILGQTYTDFALILVDDCSTDATPAIAREYAELDARVIFLANDSRLGLVDNCRRVFDLARERFPDAPYFAWASDHDLWHPRWLQALVETLDAHPEVVLTYPLNRRIGPSGEVLARRPWAFDTFGITDTWTRLSLSIRRMSAGNMVYGLYRVELLARAGVYRRVLVPDRLLMTELAVYGQFKQVPQVLWFRRWYGRIFSLNRQRKSFFPGGRPLYMYAPWWVSHGVSLFWTFGVRETGAPAITRTAGAILGLRYLVFSWLFHIWQTLRAVRIGLLERAERLRPHERRVRLVSREIRRRGIVDWTGAHMKPYVGAKARARARSRAKKGFRTAATRVLRRPGAAILRGLRAVPIVRRRVVPSLLRQEIDQVPAAPIVAEMHRELRRLRETDAPIVIGPWISEVGFEMLYWIPFLNWAIPAAGLDGRRLIAVSRGGAGLWYRHLTPEYLDVLDLFTVEEYRTHNAERWADGGNQKQFDQGPMDREILARLRGRLGLADVALLHPMVMYRLLRFFWFEKAPVGLLTKHAQYRALATVGDVAVDGLPDDYVAVRFYFRPSFPDTPDNRRFVADTIQALARDQPVVLLNTGISVDDHEDALVPAGPNLYRIDHLTTAANNLEVQTRVLSRARAFIGTYGGLTYVAPFYDVPSIGFYSHESELVPAHLDVGWRLGRLIGASAIAVDTRNVEMLGLLLGGASGDHKNVMGPGVVRSAAGAE